MSDVKYKPYVKFYFTNPKTELSSVDEVYTGNGSVEAVEAKLAVFFGDCVNTGFSDLLYIDCEIIGRNVTVDLLATRNLDNPIGFIWIRVLDKDDVFDTGTSYFDVAGVIRRAVVKRFANGDYSFYFEVSRTRNRDFYDLRKVVPDPFDYI